MIISFSLLLTINLLLVDYLNDSFTGRNIPTVIVTSDDQNNYDQSIDDVSPKRGDGRREN